MIDFYMKMLYCNGKNSTERQEIVMNEKISVIIPVYNVEAYLERCLRSVAENTYRNLEIICVNDGSTDGCAAILEKFAGQDERVQVITQENGGLSAARNSGMKVATGDFIAFIDSDDWIHPQYFEALLFCLRDGKHDIAICDSCITKGQVEEITYSLPDAKRVELNIENIYDNFGAKTYAWGKLFQRKLLSGKWFIEERGIPEDVAFIADVLKDAPEFLACYLEIPLYFYYQRDNSLSHNLSVDKQLWLGKCLFSCADETSSEKAKRAFLYESVKRCSTARYELSWQGGDRTVLKECDVYKRKIAKALCNLSNVSAKEKVMAVCLAVHPITYRLYLIAKNPSILRWEKEQKKKHR